MDAPAGSGTFRNGMLRLNAVWFAALIALLGWSSWARFRSEFWQSPTMADTHVMYLLLFGAICLLLAVSIYGSLRARRWAHELAFGLNASLGALQLAIALFNYFVLKLSFREVFIGSNALIGIICLSLCGLLVIAKKRAELARVQ